MEQDFVELSVKLRNNNKRLTIQRVMLADFLDDRTSRFRIYPRFSQNHHANLVRHVVKILDREGYSRSAQIGSRGYIIDRELKLMLRKELGVPTQIVSSLILDAYKYTQQELQLEDKNHLVH